VGAVFRWIQDNTCNGCAISDARSENSHSIHQLFCASCGIDVQTHRKTLPTELSANGMVCGNAIARLPLVDVNWWIKRHRQPGYCGFRVGVPGPRGVFMRRCEPALLALGAFVLRKIDRTALNGSNQELQTWHGKSKFMATCGLLALLMEVYVRKLTRMSIAVLQELTHLVGFSSSGIQCLTRSHVHRALLQGAFKGGLPEAIFTGCAEIGSASALI